MPDGDVRQYGATGDGSTDDSPALAHAIEVVSAPRAIADLYFPPGTYRIASPLRFPPNVSLIFAGGAKLRIERGVIVTINASVTAGRRQIFSGLGHVNFRNHAADDFSPLVDTVYPEWWGAFSGNGNPATPDCSPGVQAAVKSGVQRISFGEGLYRFLSTVTFEESAVAVEPWVAGTQYVAGDRRVRNDISFRATRDHRASLDTEPGVGATWERAWTLGSPGDLQIAGTSRTGSYLLAGQAALATSPAPNALFINDQSNGKLSFHRIRFQGIGGVSVFRGYALYANIPIFSGSIDDCWIAMGEKAAGFFFGALNNYRVSNCVFEGSPTRFTVAGPGMADVQFVNNVDYLNHGPFLDMAGENRAKNMVTVSGMHAQTLQDGVFIRADNCRNLRVTDVFFEISGQIKEPVGVLDLKNCNNLRVSSLSAVRATTGATDANFAVVMRLDGCTGTLDDIQIDGGATHIAVQGAVDLCLTNASLANASESSLVFPAATSGVVRLTGSTLRASGGPLIRHEGTGHTHDLEITSTELLDSGGAAASARPLKLATSGAVRLTDVRAGRSRAPRTSSDRGDASVTLTPLVDEPIAFFRTRLTADRRVTLSSVAFAGAKFRIVRTGLGAFKLDVGGLKTIPASTAAFVDVEHDGTAWRLTAYGTL